MKCTYLILYVNIHLNKNVSKVENEIPNMFLANSALRDSYPNNNAFI